VDGCQKQVRLAADARAVGPRTIEGEQDIVLEVNGVHRTVRVDPRTSLLDALRERVGREIVATIENKDTKSREAYACHAFGAQFCEVKVDEATGEVRVTRAIGNAVFHATGKRIRDLPITLDRLL